MATTIRTIKETCKTKKQHILHLLFLRLLQNTSLLNMILMQLFYQLSLNAFTRTDLQGGISIYRKCVFETPLPGFVVVEFESEQNLTESLIHGSSGPVVLFIQKLLDLHQRLLGQLHLSVIIYGCLSIVRLKIKKRKSCKSVTNVDSC